MHLNFVVSCFEVFSKFEYFYFSDYNIWSVRNICNYLVQVSWGMGYLAKTGLLVRSRKKVQ